MPTFTVCTDTHTYKHTHKNAAVDFLSPPPQKKNPVLGQ